MESQWPSTAMWCVKCGESELEDDNLWDGLCVSCYIRHLEGRIGGLSGEIRRLRVAAAEIEPLSTSKDP